MLPELVAEIAAALEPIADEIPDLTIYPYWSDVPSPPALDVYPASPFQTGAGFTAGNNQVFWTVRARVSMADPAGGQQLLLRLMDPNDPASVEVALQDVVVVTEGGVSAFTQYADDAPVNERMLGCEWRTTTFLDAYTTTNGNGNGGDGNGGGGGDLTGLARVPWEGGPAYYTEAQTGPQMQHAQAAGWNASTFFPVAAWLSDPNHAAELASIGVNTYLGINSDPGAITAAAAAGMFVIAQANEWTEANVAAETGNENVVGWLPADEPDLNLTISTFLTETAGVRAYDDGRFLLTNFCHGIRRSVYYSNPGTGGFTEMHNAVAAQDVVCCDQYAYTSPGIRGDPGPQGIVDNANHGDPSVLGGSGTSYLWPGAYQDYAKAQQASCYGWQARALRSLLTDQGLQKPCWVAVETQMPYLTEPGREIILYDQIKGAVWSALINEARGILYFQHNGFYGDPGSTGTGDYPTIDPNTGAAVDTDTMSLVDGPPGLIAAVTELNAQIASLAPVLNTQSLEWDFAAAGIDTMLKTSGGYAYIFAAPAVIHTLGPVTFTLPAGIAGTTVEVVDESRTVPVTAGTFEDTFANEYDYRIYKVTI